MEWNGIIIIRIKEEEEESKWRVEIPESRITLESTNNLTYLTA
jgi:hypothetical protein